MGEAIARVVHPSWVADAPCGMARKLSEALANCDALSFNDRAEAVAYAGLHLLDRYERVMQVLAHLMTVGRLPIRRVGLKVLEVGAGPAPALYATRDFYALLREWPGRTDIEVGDVQFADSVDRGKAWDMVLHHVSEQLMVVRGNNGISGLPFSRAITDFTGFDAAARYRTVVEQRAQAIRQEFALADESISLRSSYRMAVGDGIRVSSAYDFVFMCNFLTQQSMTKHFSGELARISRSLTPGGVLVVMGGTGTQYPPIYEEVQKIALKARLTEISPSKAFSPDRGPHLDVVRDHVRKNAAAALSECDEKLRSELCARLPADLWDTTKTFSLPRFQALIFVNQKKS